jgi:hypothetical protein
MTQKRNNLKSNETEHPHDTLLQYSIGLFAIIGLIVLRIYYDSNQSDFANINNGLFVVFIVLFLSFIVRGDSNIELLNSSAKIFTKKKSLTVVDYQNIILMLIYLIAAFAFILIDFKLIANRGVRFGTVVILAIINMLSLLIKKYRG